MGVLPLGTGNDLSRSLGWGGGYEDEDLSDLLSAIQSADVVKMDRWRLSTEPSDPGRPGKVTPTLLGKKNHFCIISRELTTRRWTW